MSTSIPVSIGTKLMLKELKIKLEKKLQKELTWEEFFNKIEIKIKHSGEMVDGKE